MNGFEDAAYNMAAVSATLALYRALIKKGVLTREEATGILLDEAVARAIKAEARQGPEVSATTMEIDRQCAEILKFSRRSSESRHPSRPLQTLYPARSEEAGKDRFAPIFGKWNSVDFGKTAQHMKLHPQTVAVGSDGDDLRRAPPQAPPARHNPIL